MADELSRWAARRSPELIARAEAEAVALLRDALVRAALGGEPEPVRRPVRSEEAGELVWAYCVLRASDARPEVPGVESASLLRVEAGGLAALVSRVPRAEFGEEPLRRNLNDIDWLERVARAHEQVLERALERATIVPLRLCTLYESEQGVRGMLERERKALTDALDALGGRQEWGVKLLVDRDRLMAEAAARSGESAIDADSTGDGGAYMLRRRHERRVRELADALAGELAEEVHARLEDRALAAITRPPQNRELSGHTGEMLLNAAYLVETERIAELRELVAELEAAGAPLGAHIELTGPWPPYNFVPGDAAATLA